jgi:D-alanyl-lipoteichoic acid acyltransferase DltB (MBOAT superfamily)
MDDITISSPIFLILLLSGPMLMRTTEAVRRYLFLIINIGLYAAYLNKAEEAAWILIFVLLPFIYIKLIHKRSIPVWPMIVIILSIFCYLDYFGKPSTIKLLGLSYMLFRQIDILIQINSNLIPKIDIIDYLNYLFSFWTIMAGPIQRYNEYLESFYSKKITSSNEEILQYLHRAANGMIKLLLIGAFLKNASDEAFQYLCIVDNHSAKNLIVFFYCFPLYAYFNFSGYCDVVIAMAKIAGFDIPENFDKPYLARNLIEFWNRWHITLSLWIRDYVFQPLVKFLIKRNNSKHVSTIQYLSIFITFFIVGIWHGTTFNYVIFALLQGFGMAATMFYRDFLRKFLGKLRYTDYVNNRKIAFVERIVCLHFMFYSVLYFGYDLNELLSLQLKLVNLN